MLKLYLNGIQRKDPSAEATERVHLELNNYFALRGKKDDILDNKQ